MEANKKSSAESIYPLFLKAGHVCTDTRKVISGSIFFALRGENFDGNQFAEQALKAGCAYAVVDTYFAGDQFILVDNVLATLQELARIHRRKSSAIILGITGSNGKTTTKELIYTVWSSRYKTLATEGNLNNHIGVPLTLLRLKPEHEYGIIEMGANHQGEIRDLCAIAEPDLGLITNIGKAHLEGFGGEAGVIKGKGELYDYFRNKGSGHLFVNGDSELLLTMTKDLPRTIYGGAPEAQVQGKVIPDGSFLKMYVTSGNEDVQINTNLTGSYNLPNVLAAVTIGLHCGMNLEEAGAAIETYNPSNSRSQLMDKGGAKVILDAYNANPSSMEVAIKNLAVMPGGRKVAILGDMLELGEQAEMEHRKISELLQSQKIEEVYLVGPIFASLGLPHKTFSDPGSLMKMLKQSHFAGAVILLKGSRGMRMEQILEAISA